jgi:hypothetical protein
MSVTQKFEYTWPEGAPELHFLDWIATLTQAEQDDFAQAKIRQEAHRQPFIDDGRLAIVEEGYAWKDQETADLGKPTDSVWIEYWSRWIDETGVKFSISYL